MTNARTLRKEPKMKRQQGLNIVGTAGLIGIALCAMALFVGEFSKSRTKHANAIACVSAAPYVDPCGRDRPDAPIVDATAYRKCIDGMLARLKTPGHPSKWVSRDHPEGENYWTWEDWGRQCFRITAPIESRLRDSDNAGPHVYNDALACATEIYPKPSGIP